MDIIEGRKEKLKEELIDIIRIRPQYVDEFMQVCANELTKFREKCQIDLNSRARMAIEMLLLAIPIGEDDKCKFHDSSDRHKVAILISGMRMHYPKGWESVGNPDKEVMNLFIDLVKRENTLTASEWWLNNNGHYEWLKMLLGQKESQELENIS